MTMAVVVQPFQMRDPWTGGTIFIIFSSMSIIFFSMFAIDCCIITNIVVVMASTVRYWVLVLRCCEPRHRESGMLLEPRHREPESLTA